MDDAYQAALRTWSADPHDLEAILELARAAERGGLPLPPELDPTRRVLALTEVVQEAYTHLDGGGYVNNAACARLDWSGPPEDPDRVRDALCKIHESEHGEGHMPFPCLAVHGLSEVETLRFGCYHAYEPGTQPELTAAFARIETTVDELLASLPGPRCYAVEADYPDDGEVYGSATYLLCVPPLRVSYLLVVQYVG
ncbi:MAG: hypothetical protein R3F62_10620 [Planctomycetota bacterium]